MITVPAVSPPFVGRKLPGIEPPILAGAIAGRQCSTPAITTVTRAAGRRRAAGTG
ncbi:hypothetical protein [Kitasatospora sp. NPDC087314]|uniref:hypothetical protein n=1 Tax=Kitasatospora sp. NPDC087314 TaxID=3364068 RepID=UPI00381C74CD